STLNNDRDKALFLVYATSGLRNGEVLSLSRDIDFATRALIPRNHSGKTKFAWVSFFNDETETVLRKYLASRKDNDSRLFLLEGNDSVVRIFKRASDRSGIKLTPQDLRAWFADEMDRLGVPEKYIDSFQGRIPKSVLRRNYSQYSLERLREVYDKARLTVLA
ncbi:MAG: site-specific integrase, partial [Candidatus Bathyarchaeia archaeon]